MAGCGVVIIVDVLRSMAQQNAFVTRNAVRGWRLFADPMAIHMEINVSLECGNVWHRGESLSSIWGYVANG